MKKNSLSNTNPYLKDRETRILVTAMAVKNGNDIEGIHKPLEYYIELAREFLK